MLIVCNENTNTNDMDIDGPFCLMKDTYEEPISPFQRMRAVAFSLGVAPGQWFKVKGKTMLCITPEGLVDIHGNQYPGVLYKLLLGKCKIVHETEVNNVCV